MAYTDNSKFETIATGDQSGIWGTTVNTNMDLIDEAVNGIVTVTLTSAGTSGSPNTLTVEAGASCAARHSYIEFDDNSTDLTADVFVQFAPDTAQKVVFIYNNLTGDQDLYLFQGDYSNTRDVVVAAGASAIVKFDGGGTTDATASNVFDSFAIDSLTATGTVTGSNLSGSNTGDQTFTWEKHITIESPEASDFIVFCRTDTAITLGELVFITKGTSPSVVVNLYHGTNITSGTLIDSNTVTSVTTGNVVASGGISDTTIPADSFVWATIGTVSGVVSFVHASLFGTVD